MRKISARVCAISMASGKIFTPTRCIAPMQSACLTTLLDNSPLVEFLEEVLSCEKIQESIDAGLLHALSITASGYGSGQSVTFYQGVGEIVPWRRTRRIGIPAQIGIKHLLASSALPFIFPATLINREYFGDGSMRQIAPISSE